MVRLADLTTLRVGGAAAEVVVAESVEDLIDAVRTADGSGRPPLILGGGSNVLVSDAAVLAPVVLVRTRGISADVDGCGGAWVTVAAGQPWDELVATAVASGWSGVEALSGIPGLVGATPVQNVGAYGQEVADVIARVELWDRSTGQRVTWAAADCGFGYRQSRIKRDPERYVVLTVTFQFRLDERSTPVRYAELARHLGVDVGARVPAPEVRQAVLDLRRSKAMVFDEADHDTWSVGSFFVNPVVSGPDDVPVGAPSWPQPDGSVKTSAAWLVEQAGFTRGWRPEPGFPAGLSTRHALAVTNRGGATAADILRVAGAVRAGVRNMFGITLTPEPTLVACTLD